jgi:hypothetical protein
MMIFVQEHYIERIELRYVPLEAPALVLGFTHRILDEPAASSSDA